MCISHVSKHLVRAFAHVRVPPQHRGIGRGQLDKEIQECIPVCVCVCVCLCVCVNL